MAERRFSELESAIDEIYDAVKRMPEINNAQFGAVRQELLASVNRYYANLESEAPSDSSLKRKKTDSLLKLIQLKSSLADNAGAAEIAQNILNANDANSIELSTEQRIDAMGDSDGNEPMACSSVSVTESPERQGVALAVTPY